MYGNGDKTFRRLNGTVCPFNPEAAKKCWKRGCEELGETPVLTLLIRDDSVTREVAAYIQSELKKNLGIDFMIETKTAEERNEQMDSDCYMAALTAWGRIMMM